MKIFWIKKTKLRKFYYFLGFKIGSRKNMEGIIEQRINDGLKQLKEEVLRLKMLLVENSGLYDSLYYIQKYHPDMYKREALQHYVEFGYKNSENPSEVFDISDYPKNVEPILDFLTRGYECEYLFSQNMYQAADSSINDFINAQSKRKTQKVVYTCISNNYDNLEELKGYKYIDYNWDYVCFTDSEKLIKKEKVGIWEIRPLQFTKLDNTRNNRWHKIHPHLLFPEYTESVYIDANINILTSKFFDIVNQTSKDILLPVHANNTDLYRELKWAKEMHFDDDAVVDKQRKLIEKSGFPPNYGMFENNLIYRKHFTPEIIDIMNEWWHFVENYSRRDQTSLAYIFWKHNRKISDYCLDNTRRDFKNFCIFKHKKGYAV